MDSSATPEEARKYGFWAAVSLAWQLGYVIALPIVVLALAGRFADRSYGTSPLFLIAGMVLAVAVTSVWMVRKAKTMLADLEDKAKRH